MTIQPVAYSVLSEITTFTRWPAIDTTSDRDRGRVMSSGTAVAYILDIFVVRLSKLGILLNRATSLCPFKSSWEVKDYAKRPPKRGA